MATLGEILMSYTPLGQQQMLEAAQNRRAEQYAQMLQQYGQVMPQGQAGPPAAFANPSGVSPEFAARVAGLPGYEQLGAQLLGQIGLAGREQAQRDWSAGNMTAAQRAEIEQRQKEFAANLGEQQRQFSNLSAYQQGALGLQGRQLAQQGGIAANENALRWAQLGLDKLFREEELKLKYPKGANAYPLPGSKEYDTQLVDYQDASRAVDAVDSLDRLWSSTPMGMDREALAAAQPYKAAVIGGLAKMMGSGTLDANEYQRYVGLLNEPGLFSAPGATKKRKAMLASMKAMMASRLEDMRGRNPNLPQVAAPPGFEPPKGK